MIEMKYLKYSIGNKKINGHIDAVHAQSPKSDEFTGKIVSATIKQGTFSGIISTISRTEMDINRPRIKKNAPAIDEYRETIKNILISKDILDANGYLVKNYLHLAIHGMSNDKETDFEIGTRYGSSCSAEVKTWFIKELQKLSDNIGVDNIFPGDSSKSYHRNGDRNNNYKGYGNKFHTIQIEINRTWRKKRQLMLIDFFSEILQSFDNKFN